MIPTWVTDPAGNVYVNDLVRSVKATILVPPAAQNPLTTPAGGVVNPTLSTPVIIEGGEDSVTEIFSLIGAHDPSVIIADIRNRLEVEIKDNSYRRVYMNRPILANHVFGTNLQPFFLNESIFLESQQVLNLQFYNRSALGQSVYRMAFESRKFQASALANQNVTRQISEFRQRKTFLNPFWFTSDAAVQLPAGGTVPVFFNNSRDNFLILFNIMCQTIIVQPVAPPPPPPDLGDTEEIISFRIFDSRTDRPLNNQPITLNTATGTAQFPFQLPTALMVEPRTTLRVDLTNLITNKVVDVFFTFHGVASFMGEGNPWTDQMVDQPARAMAVHGAP
jgi:hypothetical protein